LFGTFFIVSKINLIKSGKNAKLSQADIVEVNANLFEAKKSMSSSEFDNVYNIYLQLKKDDNKILMDIDEYNKKKDEIIQKFKAVTSVDVWNK